MMMRNTRLGLLATATVVGAIVLSGCAGGSATGPNASLIEGDARIVSAAHESSVNQKCTYSGYNINPEYNVTYKGETIGFCSAKTQKKFLEASESQRDAQLAQARAGR